MRDYPGIEVEVVSEKLIVSHSGLYESFVSVQSAIAHYSDLSESMLWCIEEVTGWDVLSTLRSITDP
jgi:hypothetical protein